ncbi:hypothetical protein BDY19DRAFT_962373, partial [Irpex rosettiformis]
MRLCSMTYVTSEHLCTPPHVLSSQDKSRLSFRGESGRSSSHMGLRRDSCTDNVTHPRIYRLRMQHSHPSETEQASISSKLLHSSDARSSRAGFPPEHPAQASSLSSPIATLHNTWISDFASPCLDLITA